MNAKIQPKPSLQSSLKPSVKQTAKQIEKQAETKRVLLVESCLQDRERYGRWLQQDPDCAYLLSAADSVQAAVARCLTQSFDLIVLSYRLVEGTGLALIERLRLRGIAVPPTLLIAEAGNEAIAAQALRYGVQDYLKKEQLSAAALVQAVHRVLKTPSAISVPPACSPPPLPGPTRLDAQADAQDRLAATLNAIGDGVIITDTDGTVSWMNPAAERLTSWQAWQARALSVLTIAPLVETDTHHLCLDSLLAAAIAHQRRVQTPTPVMLQGRDGRRHFVSASVSPICDRAGALLGLVLVLRDMTESQRLLNQLAWQANHDILTGLPNRRYFETQLERCWQAAQQGRQSVICYLDLDRFKAVNDTCGHAAGDCLLKQLTALMEERLPASACLARIGGDEFGLLLPETDLNAGEAIAQTLCQAVTNHVFEWEGKTLGVGVSIGVVLLTAQTATLRATLSLADDACYRAKHSGRGQVHVHRPAPTPVLDPSRQARPRSVFVRPPAASELRHCG